MGLHPERRRYRWSAAGVLLTALVLAALAIALFGFSQGWLRVDNSADTTNVQFDREGFEETTEKAAEFSDRVADRTGRALQRAGQKLQDASDQQDERNSE